MSYGSPFSIDAAHQLFVKVFGNWTRVDRRIATLGRRGEQSEI
uniref:Uncharacterized protein n=1 Tax=Agrobacterium tumefaciens TaxID=358 RepID=A0A2P0QJK5_AGRTU|nr:hypothetical protein AgrTiChry5_33 [Agrobacterium tumefaciens]